MARYGKVTGVAKPNNLVNAGVRKKSAKYCKIFSS